LNLTKKSAAATVVVVGGTVVVVVGGRVVVVVGGSVVGVAVVGGAAVVAAPAPAQEAAIAAVTKRAVARCRKGRGERLLSRGIDGHRKPLPDERSSSASVAGRRLGSGRSVHSLGHESSEFSVR
jgi:hypothetical protein